MAPNLQTTDIIEYSKLVLIFLAMFSVGKVIQRYKVKYILVLLVMLLTFPLHKLYGKSTDSVYKQLNLPRYSNQTHIKSYFRLEGRKILQDTEDEDKDVKYAKLQEQIEILSDKNKRIFYDKFDKIFENQDFDGKEFKEIYSIFLRNKIFDVVNFSFYWIIFLFILGKSRKSQQLINFGIKCVFFWTFLLVYYIYSHDLEKKSWLDYYYPYQNISHQVTNSQIIFATYLGLLCAFIYNNEQEKKQILNTRLETLRQKIDKIDLNQHSKLKGLQAQIKSYKEFLNKKQLILLNFYLE